MDGTPRARSDLMQLPQRHADITQHEIDALTRRYNLADAHTHQQQSPGQRRIVAGLPTLWYDAEARLQRDLEQEFITAFFALQRQPTALRSGRTLLAYAASISTLVAATYLMQRGMTVALIEPCFDNLHDLLANLRVPMVPIPEQALREPESIRQALARHVTADALFLVDPNNPTGHTLLRGGPVALEAVAAFCRDTRKLLVIDRCFASFALMDRSIPWFDVYEVLEASRVSYIVIEDTGKTWPVQDAKCALLTTSADVFPAVYDIHTSVLLNVSPFTLNVLTRYLRDSAADDFASVRDLLDGNRATLVQALAGTAARLCPPMCKVSVAWVDISALGIDSPTLQRSLLERREVYVIPGTYFFWNDHHRGDGHVRVALARDPGTFVPAAAALRQEVLALAR
jgi:aspartate/methionine/tyrosine aminotransferase